MKLAQLRNFVKVVEIGNLSKAADTINIVQPALSRQIKALEQELGVQLLMRRSWGVEATPAGQALASSARRILADLERTRSEVHALEHEPAGLVTVGAASSVARALFTQLFTAVTERFPKIQLRLCERLMADLVKDVHGAAVDIALMDGRTAGPGLRHAPLFTDRWGILANPRYLASLGEPISAYIPDCLFVLPSTASEARNRIERIIGRGGLQIVAEVDGLTNLLQIVSTGECATILPRCAAADYVADGRLTFVGLTDPQMRREVILAKPAQSAPNRAVDAVEGEIFRLTAELAETMLWELA